MDSIISQRALWEVYYQPFQAALEAGPWMGRASKYRASGRSAMLLMLQSKEEFVVPGCLSTMCAYNLVNGALARLESHPWALVN